ncbi:MAG TPA: CmpA/NrtA family ABC transporter substrate-binding protein [Candidatus Limnocylindrales bacterium]|nr:CmpA/NrtA family ABC transporter substrate-binding protein [Candidatus Limnocylindrales bacterium]
MSDLMPVTVGFIPLVDCAFLAVAREKGFAAAEGIDLTLVRESSWASIRDRLIVGHFDAAHLLGPMTVASTLGIRHVAVPMIAPFALGLGGNAVTFSTALRDAVYREGAPSGLPPRTSDGWRRRALDVGEALRRVVRQRGALGLEPLTFAVVFPFSCHNYTLRYWLAAVGIDPDRDVRIVVIPPPLLADSMRAGYVDGFCAGEPWNSAAVAGGVGSIEFPTTAIWRQCPDKVLGCRFDWAERRTDDLFALMRSLYRAAVWCDEAGNHAELARILAEPSYVGAAPEMIEPALSGVFTLSEAMPVAKVDDFHISLRNAATFPWTSHALWFYSQMVRWGQTVWSEAGLARSVRTYRPDLYRRALASVDVDIPATDSKIEGASNSEIELPSSRGRLRIAPCGFLDDRIFDPSDVRAYVDGFEGDEPI